MPKKPADKLRVPLNCLIAPATKAALTGIQNETNESQGEIVDRSVALLAFGEEIKAETKTVADYPPNNESVGVADWRAKRKPLLKPKERK